MSETCKNFIKMYFRPKTGYTLRRQVASWPYDEELYKLAEQVKDQEGKQLLQYIQRNELQIFALVKSTNQAETSVECREIQRILKE